MLLPFSILAQEQNPCDAETHVYFSNGIDNNAFSAYASLYSLKNSMEKEISLDNTLEIPPQITSWRLAYNPTNGKSLDLIESYKQFTEEQKLKIYEWLALKERAPEWFIDLYTAWIISTRAIEYLNDDVLQNYVKEYRDLLDNGHRIINVSHSQGNFYANESYRRLNSNSFTINSVATPTNKVEGRLRFQDDYVYVTVTKDIITNVPGSLPPNVENVGPSPDLDSLLSYRLHHNFVDTYLKGSPSLHEIGERFIWSLDTLNTPFPQGGIINVQLEWEEDIEHSFLDLHVFEPSGHHLYVWADDTTGSSGSLSGNIFGYQGPENYVVKCSDKLVEGTYKFAVGTSEPLSRPYTTKLKITAGNVEREFTKILPPYLYKTKHEYYALFIAEIDVKKLEEGSYNFEINAISGDTLEFREGYQKSQQVSFE